MQNLKECQFPQLSQIQSEIPNPKTLGIYVKVCRVQWQLQSLSPSDIPLTIK